MSKVEDKRTFDKGKNTPLIRSYFKSPQLETKDSKDQSQIRKSQPRNVAIEIWEPADENSEEIIREFVAKSSNRKLEIKTNI